MQGNWGRSLLRSVLALAITATIGAIVLFGIWRAQAEHDFLPPKGVRLEMVRFASRNSWVATIFALALPLMLTWRSRIAPTVLRDAVRTLLNEYRRGLFGGTDGEVHENRVTLFKHKKRCWVSRRFRTGGWLVSVERSGHTTLESVVCFSAPDNGKAEGIAGYAWSKNGDVVVSGLKPPTVGSPDYDREVEDYAAQTRMTPERAKEHSMTARSFYGMPVAIGETVWGAVVIDSCEESVPRNGQKKAQALFVAVLRKMIEKGAL
jgi:hypothetical protein